MSLVFSKRLFTRTNLPRLVGVAALLFLIRSYFLCSPYVCPPKTRVHLDPPLSTSRNKADHRPQTTSTNQSNDGSTPYKKGFIVAAMKGEDTSWLNKHFPDWRPNVYVMNDPGAKLTVRENKGRESMAYLTYLIDHYDKLPENMVFLHSLRYQWHNEDPMYGMSFTLNSYATALLLGRGKTADQELMRVQ